MLGEFNDEDVIFTVYDVLATSEFTVNYHAHHTVVE